MSTASPLPPKPPQINQPMTDERYLQVPSFDAPPPPSSNINLLPAAVGNYPMACTCPHCHQPILTRVEKNAGAVAWISALLLCLFGCICGCCLIPFCIDDIKDTIHYCPNCNRVIAENKMI